MYLTSDMCVGAEQREDTLRVDKAELKFRYSSIDISAWTIGGAKQKQDKF